MRGGEGSANLTAANLTGAVLLRANMTDSVLDTATLEGAALVETVLEGASLASCHVYGVTAWNIDLRYVKDQTNLIITPENEPTVTVDDLEVAQFVYLTNTPPKKLHRVINTIGQKGILILGRFTDERKAVLDAIKNTLRSATPRCCPCSSTATSTTCSTMSSRRCSHR